MGGSVTLQPQFVQAQAGRLFTLLYQPAVAVVSDVIVLLPPFGEEMNKSRRQISMQARQWCELGYPVLVFDLFGTGDSEGDFGAASINFWQQNINDIMRWLKTQGYTSATLWALRFGALFVPTILRTPVLPINRVVLWQPVTSGKQAINQFLRLQAAANLLGAKHGPSVTQLKESLNAGQTVEVAGYRISADLYRESVELDLTMTGGPVSSTIEWLQIVSGAQVSLPPLAARLIEQWRGSGIRVRGHVIQGEPFWSTVELTVVPELVTSTTRLWANGQQLQAEIPGNA